MKNYLEIVNEINRILDTEGTIDENSNSIPLDLNPNIISLYYIYNIVHKNSEEFKNLEKHFQKKIDNIISNNYVYGQKVILYGMDFNNNELSIGFNPLNSTTLNRYYKTITFSKKNNNLYIIKTEPDQDIEKIFELLKTTLSEAYDALIKFKDVKTQHSFEIKCFNSFLLANIYKYGVDIFDHDNLHNTFKLQHLSYAPNYTLNSTNNSIFRVTKDKEEEIFKKTFVKIDYCPKWMRKNLYEIRKNQINENLNKTKSNEETNIIEEKKNFKSKILSLFKK